MQQALQQHTYCTQQLRAMGSLAGRRAVGGSEFVSEVRGRTSGEAWLRVADPSSASGSGGRWESMGASTRGTPPRATHGQWHVAPALSMARGVGPAGCPCLPGKARWRSDLQRQARSRQPTLLPRASSQIIAQIPIAIRKRAADSPPPNTPTASLDRPHPIASQDSTFSRSAASLESTYHVACRLINKYTRDRPERSLE